MAKTGVPRFFEQEWAQHGLCTCSIGEKCCKKEKNGECPRLDLARVTSDDDKIELFAKLKEFVVLLVRIVNELASVTQPLTKSQQYNALHHE